MTDIRSSKFTSFDGVDIAIHEAGSNNKGGARTLLLLHGLFSHAHMNWIKFGHAAKLADAGYHIIMPDFRVHGQSDAPHDVAAYPKDVLVQDMLSLIDYLKLDDFDLAGFSLGARTSAKLLTHGIRPTKALLMGMGWEGLNGWGDRQQFFIDAIDKRDEVTRGDPYWMSVQFLKSQKIDPVAARLLLQSFGDMDVDALTEIDISIAVICGAEDNDNGSAAMLAQQLSNAQYMEVAGTHMSSVTQASLSNAMVEFLKQN